MIIVKGNLFYKEATEEKVLDLPKTPKEQLEYDLKIVQDERCRAKIENFYNERFKEEI